MGLHDFLQAWNKQTLHAAGSNEIQYIVAAGRRRWSRASSSGEPVRTRLRDLGLGFAATAETNDHGMAW